MIFEKMYRSTTKLPKLLLLVGVLINSINLSAQIEVFGEVVTEDLEPIPGASIQVIEIQGLGSISDLEGKFSISMQYKDEYTLKISAVGFSVSFKKINLRNENVTLRVILQEDISILNEVIIDGKTKTDIIKEQAFEVEAIEVKELKNASVDVNGILATIPGVNIRQSGGLGSNFNFSLNGFTGNQVKFFIDGIPQDNLGSSLSLNNFPATLVDRVEVYKGAVPVFLGADALGGAINIVTNQEKKNFLDVSYDVGSFNTHRATLNGHYYTNKGFAVKVSSFYNYSDNDYRINTIESGVKGIPVRDKFGNISDSRVSSVKRFHDAYESQMVQAKVGVVDKKIADELFVGVTASANDNELQHNITPSRPFGEVTNKTKTIQTFFTYQKKILKNKMKIKLYGELARIKSKSIDTSSFVYNWFGERKVREVQFTLGELGVRKTLLEFEDSRKVFNGSTSVKFDKQHSIEVNYTKNYLKRKGNDEATTTAIPFETPHVLDKNILGVAYNLDMFQRKWKSTLFGKGFFTNTSGLIEVFEDRNGSQETKLDEIKNKYDEYGYGIASRYKVLRNLQLKGSFENTFRIPEGYEFFGDGLLLQPNLELEPEESSNLNLGVLFSYKRENLKIKFDANLFKREAKNYIFLTSTGILSRYNNVTDVSSWGLENEITLNFLKNLNLSANVTYQDIQQTQGGKQFRLSNTPYLFGNFRLSKPFKDVLLQNTFLTLHWSSFFVEEFPLQSFVEGNPQDRLAVPRQISHNFQLDYSLSEGKYNISFSVKNLTNESVFDNFLVQQPGSFFSIKFRYLFQNIN